MVIGPLSAHCWKCQGFTLYFTETSDGYASKCAKGYKCPAGSYGQIACISRTFQPQAGTDTELYGKHFL